MALRNDQISNFERRQNAQPIGPYVGAPVPPGAATGPVLYKRKPKKLRSNAVKPNVTKAHSLNPSVNGSLNINIVKGSAAAAPSKGQQGVPGGDFTSNEDIRAFSEYLRKDARKRSVERSLDAEMLEARLRNIPDVGGSMAGARSRARKVTKHAKRIAQAEKQIAKYSTALYSAFEREYEAELMKIGKGRQQQKPTPRFNWTR